MKARTVFAVGLSLLALWLTAAHLVAGATERLVIGDQLQSHAADNLFKLSRWHLRYAPIFVVGATLFATPLLAWLMPRVLSESPGGTRVREVLPWMAVALASWVAVLLLTEAWVGSAYMLLWWSAGLATALVIGLATLAQSRLERTCRSRLPASAVLYAGIALYLALPPAGLLVGIVPALSSRGDGARRPTKR